MLASYIKPACLSSDVYKGKEAVLKSYNILKPRLIELPNKRGEVGICVRHETKLYLALRGCKNIDEVLYCIETGMVKPFPERAMKFNKAVWNKYEEVHDLITEAIKESLLVADEEGAKIEQVVFTGHSLGGALSQIAALFHHNAADYSKISINYGAPYVGDNEYKKECDTLIPLNTRIVVKQDIIPRMRFNNELVHTGKEVHLNSLSKTKFPYNIYDHHSSINYLRCLRALQEEKERGASDLSLA